LDSFHFYLLNICEIPKLVSGRGLSRQIGSRTVLAGKENDCYKVNMKIFNKSKMIKHLVIQIYCLFCLIIFSGCGLTSNLSQYNQEFHFILKYGADAKNVLNTFDGTFTKDMIVDSSITTTLSLTPDELDSVKYEMGEIKIFDYPEKFTPRELDYPSDVMSTVDPHFTYYFKIQIGDQLKEILWNDINYSMAAKAIKLRNLINHLVRMIHNKNEFKKLPPVRDGYL